MRYGQKLAHLLVANIQEADRIVENLTTSLNRLEAIMPMEPAYFAKGTADDKERLDAFRVRFSDLQDILGNKIFRSLLAIEEEEIGSQLDVLNKIAKRELIHSLEEWRSLRNILHVFSDEYPESDDERREALNIAYQSSNELIAIHNKTKQYLKDKFKIEI